MKLEIDKGLVMSLPSNGESYGIKNLRVIAAYAGRVTGKIRRYAKDSRLSLIEGVGVYRLTKNAIEAGKEIDYDMVRLEITDLDRSEMVELEKIAIIEYERSSKEAENLSSGSAIIHDFLDLGSAVVNFISKRTKDKVA